MPKDFDTLAELELVEPWSIKDARAKFSDLLERSLLQPQVIAPQRGQNADERFVCVPLSQYQAIAKQLLELKLEMKKQKAAQLLDEVRLLYADSDQDLVISRAPPKPALDFGYGKVIK